MIVSGANGAAVRGLIKSIQSGKLRGDMTGTTNGNTGVDEFPFGTFVSNDPPALGTFAYGGVLVNAGPNGESDYTDARYWVREIIVAQGQSSSPNDLPTININTTGSWLTCTNLSEVATGTHLLPVYSGTSTEGLTGASVTTVNPQLVESIAPTQGNQVYVFGASVTQQNISFQVTSNFAAGTYWGRYKATSYLPNTGTATSPGTPAGTEDIILINGAEWGLATSNNLLVAPNTTTFAVIASGVVVGSVTISSVVYKIVVSWIGFAACTNGAGDIDGGSP